MATKSEPYVDTSALIALLDRADTYHLLFQRLFSAPPALVTSALVIAEAHAWFLRRYDSNRALQFLAMVEQMRPLKVLSVGSKELKAGTLLLRRFSDQRLTLADAVGLHLMASRGVRSCWSTDRHLALLGASLVIHEV